MTSRREWLGSLGAVAVGGCAAGFNAVLGANPANNPAANVAGRMTTIKITKLTATPVMRKVFLKIETRHTGGIT